MLSTNAFIKKIATIVQKHMGVGSTLEQIQEKKFEFVGSV